MNTKKFAMSELFHITSGVRITQEEVYKHYGDIPVITSQTKKEGIAWYADRKWLESFSKNGNSLIFECPCISWTKEGNAGKMFVRTEAFFPIDVAGVLIPKTEINLVWFVHTFQEYFYTKIVSKGGQGKLYEEQMSNIEVDIPVNEEGEIDIDIQNEIYSKYEQRLSFIDIAEQSLNKITKQLEKHVQYESEKFKVSELFHITSGVRITQTDIYNNTGDFPVVTSQTKNEGIAWFGDKNWLMTIEKNSKKVIVDQECLTWTKDGAKCGTMFHRNYEFYPNDHCGVLVPRKPVNLKWLKLVMQPIVYSSVVAKDAQGMLYEEQMANIEVDIPIDSEGEIDLDMQNEIYKEYETLTTLKSNLQKIISTYKI